MLKSTLSKLYYDCKLKSIKSAVKNHKAAFVFGAPFHSNMGDQAQTYCIEEWINRNYPDYTVLTFDTGFITRYDYKILEVIRKLIKKDDMIFLHSGYHTTDLYMMEERMQRKVITMFPDRRIVVLPQTVNYVSDEEKAKTAEIYNKHDNLIFLSRDDVSYGIATGMLTNAKNMLFPDIVTTMIGRYSFDSKRNGILLCLRNDKESLYDADTIKDLVSELGDVGRIDITDTTIAENPKVIAKNRKAILEEIWKKFSSYNLVITDRYHGTIFSLVAGTPVLVLSSTDHKLQSGVRWFPESFCDYVKYVPETSELVPMAKEMLAKEHDHRLPDYFNKEYYDKLKDYIEG